MNFKSFVDASPTEVNQVISKSADCFLEFSRKTPKERAVFLRQIAWQVEKMQATLLETAHDETNLSITRLKAELERTIGQLKEFAQLSEHELWKDYSPKNQGPEETSNEKHLLLRQNLPIGPVGVIGACNFPFAISVVGTDTASALAVGCPVVVKSHPNHPKTCELLCNAVKIAIQDSKMPDSCFSLIHGKNHIVTTQLVAHPKISCVAFTGSLKAGEALAKVAANRPIPIPFHAEMGSLNPVFVLPYALIEQEENFSRAFIDAINLFAGQMCTKPGALIIMEESFTGSLCGSLVSAIVEQECLPMLNDEVFKNFKQSVSFLETKLDVIGESAKKSERTPLTAKIKVFQISAKDFLENRDIRTESFGPSSLIVIAKTFKEMLEVAHQMEGSLTGSIHAAKEDEPRVRQLLPILTSKVGRILWNEFPPGVIPGIATHHGGPWPATTDSRFTSIGIQGYKRFVRPLCRQGFPLSSSMP